MAKYFTEVKVLHKLPDVFGVLPKHLGQGKHGFGCTGGHLESLLSTI